MRTKNTPIDHPAVQAALVAVARARETVDETKARLDDVDRDLRHAIAQLAAAMDLLSVESVNAIVEAAMKRK
jgi:hypothetical protein